MVEGGRGPSFPVVFFDGEREINIGDVKINPSLDYKTFQHMLGRKIGISPNQISIYLVDRKRNPNTPFSEDRRRIPITVKVNFGLICSQRDRCFLVVLKRSRKSWNRREMMAFNSADFLSDEEVSPPLENLVLLRTNQQAPVCDRAAMGKGNFNSIPTPTVDSPSGLRKVTPATSKRSRKAFCDVCEDAARNGSTASFHHCVNDAVITAWFTPRMGPINRPCRAICS